MMEANLHRMTRYFVLYSPVYLKKFRSTSYVNRNFVLSSIGRLSDVENERQPSQTRPSRPSRIKNIEDIKRVTPKQYELSFEEYVKMKSSLRARKNIAGLPFALLGLGTSSVVSAYMFPEMFDATPENVQLIM